MYYARNVVLNNIKTNYNALETEVLDLLENKVGIKEVKDKSSSIIQDNDTQETEEESESNETSDTVVDKDIVDRDKDFNTSSPKAFSFTFEINSFTTT